MSDLLFISWDYWDRHSIQNIQCQNSQARFISAGIVLIAGFGHPWITWFQRNPLKAKADANIPLAIHIPNEPMGDSQQHFPGRVVWAWNPDATNENCSPNNYGDGWCLEKNNNQGMVDQMMHDAILKLTGEKIVQDAWDTLFRFHNLRKNQTNVSYTPGEKIFIKINVTSAWGAGETWGNMTDNFEKVQNDYYGTSETSPQIVLSVLRQLIDSAGINQSPIFMSVTR